jgi:hypothetical protein
VQRRRHLADLRPTVRRHGRIDELPVTGPNVFDQFRSQLGVRLVPGVEVGGDSGFQVWHLILLGNRLDERFVEYQHAGLGEEKRLPVR